MPITTEVYRRETSQCSETISVVASIDDEGAEIRVIQEQDGEIVTDSIPHWGEDRTAGQNWLDQHREARVADGYRIAEKYDNPEQ